MFLHSIKITNINGHRYKDVNNIRKTLKGDKYV